MADQLPPKVLLNVFSHVPTPLPGVQHDMLEARDLVPLTTVCRSWRDAALGMTSVWSTVSYNTRKEQSPRFRFSPQAGEKLRVHIITKHLIDETAFPFDMRRIQDLYIETYQGGGVRVAEVFRSQYILELPALERCTIVGGDIQTQIFPGSTQLRELQLLSCRRIVPTPLPSLTELHISECDGVGTGLVLGMLSGAPLLQDFKLVLQRAPESLPADVEDRRTRQTVIRLPHLRVCEVFCPLVQGNKMSSAEFQKEGETAYGFQQGILAHLAIPSSCTIRVGWLTLGDLSSVLDRTCAGRKPTHVYVGQRWPRRCIRGPVNVLNSFSFYALDLDTRLDVGIKAAGASYLEMRQPVQDEVQRCLADTIITFATVRRLWMELPWFRGPTLSILPHLHDLEFLCLFGSPHHSQPLGDLLNSLSVPPTGEAPCPKLTTLVVDCHGDSTRAHGVSVPSVLALVWGRAAAGWPLHSLFICLEERREGQLVRVLHEYDGHGNLVRVDPRPGVRARMECKWAEGIPWTGPSREEFEIAQVGLGG
ncbi:hypothetical protein GY45DRAFT_1321646 [Cubamyces sp. BRFM 1775]|nr:hypothetical protein GY45DRAFT_1321646 [Cubamyces sp. BRFM 1775]